MRIQRDPKEFDNPCHHSNINAESRAQLSVDSRETIPAAQILVAKYKTEESTVERLKYCRNRLAPFSKSTNTHFFRHFQGVFHQVLERSYVIRLAMATKIKLYSYEPFLQLKVSDFLFGYYDELLEWIYKMGKTVGYESPMRRFSLLDSVSTDPSWTYQRKIIVRYQSQIIPLRGIPCVG